MFDSFAVFEFARADSCSLWRGKISLALFAAVGLLLPALAGADESRRVLWGDTHLQPSYSFDAFLNGNRSADPDTAYRWAKGLPVIHPYHRARVQIETPLDFLVVADHAEYLGVIRKLYYDVTEGPAAGFAEEIRAAMDGGRGAAVFSGVLPVATIESGHPARNPSAADLHE